MRMNASGLDADETLAHSVEMLLAVEQAPPSSSRATADPRYQGDLHC
jgi:hypothetical protein